MYETTILVSFNDGTDSDEYLTLAELDDVLNIDSNGDVKTSFGEGDEPYFRFHCSDNIQLDAVASTLGSLINIGTANRVKESSNVFASRDDDALDSHTLPVVPSSYSVTYEGNVGSLLSETTTGGLVTLSRRTSHTPFSAFFLSSYRATIFQLVPPALSLGDDETFNIYVVFYVSMKE